MTSSLRSKLALVPLCSLLVVWIWLLGVVSLTGHKGTVAKDASDYISAAQVLHRGDNPYNWHNVWEDKRRMVGLSEHTKAKQLARVAEPPVLFWAMEPLGGRPLAFGSTILEIVFTLSAVVGLWASLAAFGWRHPVVPILIGLALPPVTYYVFIANLGVLVFAFCSLGLLLARRHPLLAGCLLSVAICKPQLALPLAGLVLLFHSASWRRTLVGFVLGAAGILGASALTAGPVTLLWWMAAFHSFTDTLRYQTLFASLNVLYEPYVPAHISALIAAVLVLLAGAATLLALRRYWAARPIQVRQIAWLWLLWFAVAPYDHYYDYIFLAPVVLSFLTSRVPGDRVRALIILYAVTLTAPIQSNGEYVIAPCLLAVVLATCLVPWPLRRRPVSQHVPAAQSYGTTARTDLPTI